MPPSQATLGSIGSPYPWALAYLLLSRCVEGARCTGSSTMSLATTRSLALSRNSYAQLRTSEAWAPTVCRHRRPLWARSARLTRGRLRICCSRAMLEGARCTGWSTMPLVTTRSFARSRNFYAQLRTSEAWVPHWVPLKSQATLGSVSLHHTRALLCICCSRAVWRAHDARDRPTMYALHASLHDHRGSARAGLTSCCDRCAASLSDPCACSLWQALHGSPMGCSTSHCRRPSHLAFHHRHSDHCLRLWRDDLVTVVVPGLTGEPP
jgi:hypothetical protein